MAAQGILFKKDSLGFDGSNYTMWKRHMEVHLKCLEEDYWKITKNTYFVPQNGPSTLDEVKEAFLSALIDSKMINVIELQTAHETWEKLEILYEGNTQVKVSKLQSLK